MQGLEGTDDLLVEFVPEIGLAEAGFDKEPFEVRLLGKRGGVLCFLLDKGVHGSEDLFLEEIPEFLQVGLQRPVQKDVFSAPNGQPARRDRGRSPLGQNVQIGDLPQPRLETLLKNETVS